MDTMDTLKEIVRRSVFWYAGGGHHLEMYRLSSPDEQVFAVSAVTTSGEYPAAIVVQARLAGDTIIIDADNTDRPLVERLMAEGIPREKIIRAYAGEAVSPTPQP